MSMPNYWFVSNRQHWNCQLYFLFCSLFKVRKGIEKSLQESDGKLALWRC